MVLRDRHAQDRLVEMSGGAVEPYRAPRSLFFMFGLQRLDAVKALFNAGLTGSQGPQRLTPLEVPGCKEELVWVQS